MVKAHCRIERRRIRIMTPVLGLVNHPHVAQMFEIEREQGKPASDEGQKSAGSWVYLGSGGRGTPEPPLKRNRGHSMIQNLNHRARDVSFGEDACLSRKGHAPANNATCNNIAFALIFRRSRNFVETKRRFALHRGEAIEAILMGLETIRNSGPILEDCEDAHAVLSHIRLEGREKFPPARCEHATHSGLFRKSIQGWISS